MGNKNEVHTFAYNFKLENGEEKKFVVKLDMETLDYIPEPQEDYPEWTKLDVEQCPNCPLDLSEHKYCPVAKNASDVIQTFVNNKSFERVQVTIDTNERSYTKETDLQKCVGTILGLIMVTSGCSHLDKLRPMARFHLPFGTLDETVYRVVSMYLVMQFFKVKRNEEPDWEMKDLHKMYDEIRVINTAFIKRLRSINPNDATLNGLIILFNLEQFINLVVNDDSLNDIKQLFDAQS